MVIPNYKIIFTAIGGMLVALAYWFSLTGLGLPSQQDPLSIRQESATQGRTFRGGASNFGK